MSSYTVVGLQWGDEGKGKITDYLTQKCDYVVRYQGGNNAGHTVKVEGKKFVLHVLPSGVIAPNTKCIIGPGVVVDPRSFFSELQSLHDQDVYPEKLWVAARSHVILPYHNLIDQYKEEAKGNDSIGTTKKGIGPCYEDKISRIGIRMIDLIDPEVFKKKLKYNLDIKNEIITKIYEKPAIDFDEIYNEYSEYARRLKPHVIDAVKEVNEALDRDDKVLFEGAQALMLDIDHGTYPYVTSSSPSTGGVTTGAGVAPNRLEKFAGVAKAYCTRVGNGPFATQLDCEIGEALQQKGGEFGATTGRPRRCGWLDLVALNYAATIDGITHLVITKMDVLSGFKTIKACVGYKQKDGTISKWHPADTENLWDIEPVYEEFPGWEEDITQVKNMEDLPENCKKYLKFIEEYMGREVAIVSVGPERNQNIIKKDLV